MKTTQSMSYAESLLTMPELQSLIEKINSRVAQHLVLGANNKLTDLLKTNGYSSITIDGEHSRIDVIPLNYKTHIHLLSSLPNNGFYPSYLFPIVDSGINNIARRALTSYLAQCGNCSDMCHLFLLFLSQELVYISKNHPEEYKKYSKIQATLKTMLPPFDHDVILLEYNNTQLICDPWLQKKSTISPNNDIYGETGNAVLIITKELGAYFMQQWMGKNLDFYNNYFPDLAKMDVTERDECMSEMLTDMLETMKSMSKELTDNIENQRNILDYIVDDEWHGHAMTVTDINKNDICKTFEMYMAIENSYLKALNPNCKKYAIELLDKHISEPLYPHYYREIKNFIATNENNIYPFVDQCMLIDQKNKLKLIVK